MELSSKQRAFLMSLANDIDPVVQIGKNGVSPEAVKSADETFNTRELLKGSVLKTAPDDPGSTAEMLAGRCRATVAIHHTAGEKLVFQLRHGNQKVVGKVEHRFRHRRRFYAPQPPSPPILLRLGPGTGMVLGTIMKKIAVTA